MLLKKIIKLSDRGRSTSLMKKKYKSAMTVDSVADKRQPSARSYGSSGVVPMTARNYTCKQSFDLSEA